MPCKLGEVKSTEQVMQGPLSSPCRQPFPLFLVSGEARLHHMKDMNTILLPF
jgi:hypothetical protein